MSLPRGEVRVLSCPGERGAYHRGWERNGGHLESGCVSGMWSGGPGCHASGFCMATHSSPGGRPALEAQRKPRLSERQVNWSVAHPATREGERELTFAEKGLGPHPALLPSSRACCGLRSLGAGDWEGPDWKEKWREGRSRGHAIPGEWGEVRRDLGTERRNRGWS